jgi:type I restriction enzyme, S subunit
VSELPVGWQWTTMGEIAATSLGKMLDKKKATGKHPTPYLRNVNVRWGRFDLNDVGSMDIRPDELDRVLARPGDVIACEGGEPGRAAVWHGPDPIALQKALHRIRPTDDAVAQYLALLLWHLSESGSLASLFTGTTIKHLPQEKLRVVRVPLPPLGEQERIVRAVEKHFSRLDAAGISLRRALVNVGRQRRSLVRQLFTDRGWSWTTLGEIADLKGGVTKDAKHESDPGLVELPYLRVANVQRGHLDLSEVSTIHVPGKTARALRLEPSDILFNEGGDRDKLGRGWVWEGQIRQCIHQNHVFRARLLTDAFDPFFVSTHGNTWGREWFEEHGRQTTNLASISLTTLKQFPVPAPSRAEQLQIMTELDRVMTELDAVESAIIIQLRRAQSLRRSILAAAFSGYLVPQDLNNAPASVLRGRVEAARVRPPRKHGRDTAS